MSNPKPRPPAHLSKATRQWWTRMVSEYGLEGEFHALKLLTIASEALDRRTEARQAIAKDGVFVIDRFGQTKAHPGIAVERDQAIVFTRCLRELALPIEDPDNARPPRISTGART